MLSLDSLSIVLLLFVTLVVIVISYFYRLLVTKHEYFVRQGLNGPDPTIPTGSWRSICKLNIGEEDLERITRYGKVHGTFDGAVPNLIVAEPELIKKILHDDANHFRSRRAYRVKNDFLRNALLSSEGYDNKELKTLLISTLSKDKIKKLVPRVNQSTDSLINILNKEIQNNKELFFNISQKVKEYVGEVLAFTMLGVEFLPSNNFKEQFTKAVEDSYFVKYPNFGLTVTPFLFDSIASLDNFILNKPSLQFLVNICQATMQARRKQEVNTTVAKAVDFLDLLLAGAEEEKQKAAQKGDAGTDGADILLNDNQIVTQLVSTMLSIVQVTKYTLALSLHTLAKLPAVQDKLRMEINKELQVHHEFTFDMVQGCEYLDMFMGEMLRLYPLEYRVERECAEDLTIGETKVEAGVLVSIPVYAIHRHKDFYPEPDMFEPGRFSSENASKREHYTYLPFGQAGANSTNVGIQLGVLVTKLAIAVLVNDFKWLPGDDLKVPVEFVKGMTGVPCPQTIFIKAEVN